MKRWAVKYMQKLPGKRAIQEDIFVGSALIDMYGKCESLAKAEEVFDNLLVRDIVTWNSIIAVYIQHECSEVAMKCLELMQLDGVFPDAITFTCVLKACGCIEATEKGIECHAEVVRKGLLEFDCSPGVALIDMYGMFGSLALSQEVFDELPSRSVVTWNALIAGYVQHGNGVEALNCLEQMQLEGIQLNATTYTCSLKACGIARNVEKGIELHAEIVRQELWNIDTFVGIALVDMYAKCGLLTQAQDVFDMLSVRNVVTWTALIAGYVQQELGEEALNCYKQMQMDRKIAFNSEYSEENKVPNARNANIDRRRTRCRKLVASYQSPYYADIESTSTSFVGCLVISFRPKHQADYEQLYGKKPSMTHTAHNPLLYSSACNQITHMQRSSRVSDLVEELSPFPKSFSMPSHELQHLRVLKGVKHTENHLIVRASTSCRKVPIKEGLRPGFYQGSRRPTMAVAGYYCVGSGDLSVVRSSSSAMSPASNLGHWSPGRESPIVSYMEAGHGRLLRARSLERSSSYIPKSLQRKYEQKKAMRQR